MQITMLYSETEWDIIERIINGNGKNTSNNINGFMLSRVNKLCQTISKSNQQIVLPATNKVRHNITILSDYDENLTELSSMLQITNSRLIARFITDPLLYEYYRKNGMCFTPPNLP